MLEDYLTPSHSSIRPLLDRDFNATVPKSSQIQALHVFRVVGESPAASETAKLRIFVTGRGLGSMILMFHRSRSCPICEANLT